MPQFAANLSMMYPDMDFLDRFEAAAKDGFKAVEYLFPYAYAAEELAARLKGNGLQQVLFNMPPGGIDDVSTLSAWEKGDRGTACSPGREAEYKAGVKRAMRYAEILGCPRIHSMAGVLPAGVSRDQAQATLVANLKWACQEVRAQGLDVLLEPINLRGIPGFFCQPTRPCSRNTGASERAQFKSPNGFVPLPNCGGRCHHQIGALLSHRQSGPPSNCRCATSSRTQHW